jgi:hypothetical protein
MQFNRLRRRECLTLIGGAAAWPFAASAQKPKNARLGYLAPASNPDLQQVLLGGLRDLGYVEGQNLAIEYRFMLGQSKSYDELAAALAGLAPDAIVVVGTPPALAAKRQTSTIPIIMAPAADPLRTGLVTSLSFSSAFPGNLVVSSAMALSPDRTETPSKASTPCGLARSLDGGQLIAMTRLISPRLCGMTGRRPCKIARHHLSGFIHSRTGRPS